MQTKTIPYGTMHTVKVITSEKLVVAVVDAQNEGYILTYHGLDPLPKIGDAGIIVFEKNNTPAKGHWQYYPKVKLEYFDGTEWIPAGEFYTENIAWISLGGDDFNYRTVDVSGKVLTDKSKKNEEE